MRIPNKLKHIIWRLMWGKDYKGIPFWRKNSRGLAERYNTSEPRAENSHKMVVFMCDGRVFHGGLSDRLQGIASIYKICRKNNIDFRIHWSFPFNLSRIFEPNKLDWSIDDSQMSYHAQDSAVYNLVDQTAEFPVDKRNQLIEKLICDNKYKQIHIYSNDFLAFRDGSFSMLFHELFRLTPEMQQVLEPHLNALGENYICVTTRFCSLLGDFDDIDRGSPSDEEKKAIINHCIHAIEEIHQEYPGVNVFMATDSVTFMEAVKVLPYTYSLCVSKENIDRTKVRDFSILQNAVIDFFLVSKSAVVIQIKDGLMYGGHFAETAALINQVPFEVRNI